MSDFLERNANRHLTSEAHPPVCPPCSVGGRECGTEGEQRGQGSRPRKLALADQAGEGTAITGPISLDRRTRRSRRRTTSRISSPLSDLPLTLQLDSFYEVDSYEGKVFAVDALQLLTALPTGTIDVHQ